jgi:hypothetical protein
LASRRVVGISPGKPRAQGAVEQRITERVVAMKLRRSLRGAVAALGVLAAGPAASAEADTATFDLSVSGVRVGVVTLASEQSDGAYVATSKIAMPSRTRLDLREVGFL